MRLLAYMESPMHATGFGLVNKHMLAACAREVGILTLVATGHYYMDYDHFEYPYDILGCETTEDQRNLRLAKEQIEETDWDIFVYQGDFGANNEVLAWAYQVQQAHPEREIIFYLPLDCDRILPHACDALYMATVPVVYTNFAKDTIAKYRPDLADKISVIWLGTEPDVFYPMSVEEKRQARLELFGEEYLDRFLCINVNRNQQRKDMARCIGAFHQFHAKHPDSSLYLHSVIEDQGGSLIDQAVLVGCDVEKRPGEILFSSLNLAAAPSRETLNKFYNACDVLISTAYGEGWGLTTTEAMCAGIPVLVPRNTANLDIIGMPEERGWTIRTGGDLDHTVFLYGPDQRGSPRDIIHVESFVNTLIYMLNKPEKVAERVQKARQWCLEHTWETFENTWQQLLQLMKRSKISGTGETQSALQTTLVC